MGYSLVHAYGAVLDNPELIVACVVGDGEAETGPLAASWHSNKFLDPVGDGAVLPILHLNGYKIANPTVLARLGDDELTSLLVGYGHRPIFVRGDEPADVHQQLAAALDDALEDIATIQAAARSGAATSRPAWPMIVLCTPKGWTCPKEVDGVPIEGTFRAHQVPVADVRANPAHLKILEDWLRSYRPEELFDESGGLRPALQALAADRDPAYECQSPRQWGIAASRLEPSGLPQVWRHGRDTWRRIGRADAGAGELSPGCHQGNPSTFRIVGPDETISNRLSAVFEATDRVWEAETLPGDEFLATHGRVMEVLSEHLCEGWLEGYLLTGRHGLFNCYEAFIHIVDSMLNQHAKWLKTSKEIPWRRPVASLNYLLSSHVWRQDHNGFSHQDPGFIDHLVNKKPSIVRVYLPPDANTLLSVADHCLRSRDYVNLIVAGKQPALSYLTMEEAVDHCTRGLGIFEWASNDHGELPDVVLGCAGDIPTLETVAAASILREMIPDLKVRVVNVVDLMRMSHETQHPHGLPEVEFDGLFTKDRPVIFAYHGYPWLIHRLAYRHTNHHNFHVRGYKEEGATTTPFDMAIMNDMDRFHLVMDVIDRVPGLSEQSSARPAEDARCETGCPGIHA